MNILKTEINMQLKRALKNIIPKNIGKKEQQSRGLKLDKETFKLIGNKESKRFNIGKEGTKLLHYKSQKAILYGLQEINWRHKGTRDCVLNKTAFARRSHDLFINILKRNKNKNKSVLVVGPAQGYETKYIAENIKNVKIDTFDIIDAIDNEYKKNINNIFVSEKGIENYVIKEMIGKYDGITAMYSAGYWARNPERNIIKRILMLKPKGTAIITVQEPMDKLDNLAYIFKKLKLNNIFSIELAEKDDIELDNLIITRK